MAVTGGSPSFASLTVTGDALIDGVTVGQGGGNVATNTALGASALSANTSGSNNVAVGYRALSSMTTGNTCVAVGQDALKVSVAGSENTAVGFQSMGATLTASRNSALGLNSLSNNTTGSNNVAIGYGALSTSTTTSDNTAVGYQALPSNTSGTYNTALGGQDAATYSPLNNNTTATGNTAIGTATLSRCTVGGNNTAVGRQAGYSVVSSTDNTYIGQAAGYAHTGAGAVFLGSSSSAGAAGDNFTIVIGYSSTGKGASTGFINASNGVYQGNNSASWSTTSDRRLKKNIVDNTEGLDIISQIRVRNFEYRTAEEVTELPTHSVIKKTGVQLGVIAQELQEVCGDCVKTESTGVMSVNSDNLTWHMINAIKDLKAELDTVKAELAALKG
jgi:hypothetical protein